MTSVPDLNVDQTNTRREHKGGARLDLQFTPQTRLTARDQYYDQIFFDGGGATSHPSAAFQQHPHSSQLLGMLTQVFGNSTVNELKGGYLALFNRDRDALVKWQGGCIPDNPVGCWGTPRIAFRGYSFGGPGNSYYWQNLYSGRDDFTRRYNRGGGHVMKLGGEYIRNQDGGQWCNFCFPQLLAGTRSSANIEALVPVWDDLRPGTSRRCRRSSHRSVRRCRKRSSVATLPRTWRPHGCRMTGRSRPA